MGGVRFREGQFTLYKRDKVWYYWTYDSAGKRHRYSTGMLKKVDAFDYCSKLQAEHSLLKKDEPRRARTVTEYGKDFWNYDTCPIIQNKIMRGGRFGVETALQNQRAWELHIEPFFRNKSPQEITYGDINHWLLNLPKAHKISNKTANNSLVVFRQMLDQMVIDGYITVNPAENVKPLIVKRNRRGAFTLEQVEALFSTPFSDEYAHVALLLAAKTGMRLGEIRALTKEQIFSNYILVDASWAKKEGRKCTKSGYERTVPIPEDLRDRLLKLAPPKGGLIFTLNGKTPVNDHFITHRLRRRMDEINKARGERFFDYKNKKKPLSFHSFRHFLDTRMLAADMPEAKIQAIIGHESDEMTEHYAHLSVEDLGAFRNIQESIRIA